MDISKVDIDGGAIDGTAIGASSASTGAFSTVTASGSVTANANLSVKNGATGAGTVTFYEDSDDGSNYVALKAGTVSSDVTWTLPTADGTSGQVISTDGSGVLSWSSVSGGSLSNATTTVGTGSADAKLASSGEYDLILQTGNSTTGTITITDGANGNIAVTPNGTGEVDISKVDIDGGAIDGTAIGGSSAAAGAFTTITASTSLDVTGSTGIILENDETITNSTDGTVAITATTTSVSGDLTVTGNDITFGNGETISNATDGDFLFTTGTAAGALTLKNSNGSDGIAALELVSDNAGDVGDAYELQSLNGTFTITSDHSTKGTYNDTYFTISGNSTPSSSTTTIAGDISVGGGLTISGAGEGINTTSGSNVAHDEASGTTLPANNNRRGIYTLTTGDALAAKAASATITVQNNTVTADDIVIMNCTSDKKIEIHTFNVSSTGWDFFFVSWESAPLQSDTALELNFIVIQ